MADGSKMELEVTGKSRYEVAHRMAINILTVIEKRKWQEISRQQYLDAVAQAVTALGGASK
jgi:hypothetical protein